MKTKLTCPVCDRPEIEDNICPNCETNLSLFRTLAELPVVTEAASLPKPKNHRKNWWLLGIGISLAVGISLGFGTYFLFEQHLMAQQTTPAADQMPIQSPPSQPTATQSQMEENSCGGFYYVVKPDDSLSLIASRFYGNENSWSLITQANPEIEERENFLEIGETLLVPNLRESCS